MYGILVLQNAAEGNHWQCQRSSESRASHVSTGPVYRPRPRRATCTHATVTAIHVVYLRLHPLHCRSPAAERTAIFQMPVVGLEAWFTHIPPVTRTWLALSVLTSVAVVCPLLPTCWAAGAPAGPYQTRMMTDSHISLFPSRRGRV